MTRTPEERLLTEANAAADYMPRLSPRLPVYETADRPDPFTAGMGALIYDADLSKPLASDGTIWRDLTGAAA